MYWEGLYQFDSCMYSRNSIYQHSVLKSLFYTHGILEVVSSGACKVKRKRSPPTEDTDSVRFECDSLTPLSLTFTSRQLTINWCKPTCFAWPCWRHRLWRLPTWWSSQMHSKPASCGWSIILYTPYANSIVKLSNSHSPTFLPSPHNQLLSSLVYPVTLL